MILYVLRYWPTLTETFVHDEIRALRSADVPVVIAAFDPRGDPHPEPPPAPVHARPHRWGWLAALPGLLLEWLRRPALVRPRVLWLAALVRGKARVHVHFAGEAAEWAREACLRAGVPWSVTVHAADLFKPSPGITAVLRGAAAVVTVSEHNRTLLAERYGVEARVVRCGVAIGEREEPEDPPVILAVGRWVPKKGLDTLLEAAARLDRRATVRLVSDAPASLFAECVGLLPRARVAEELARATVFALPCRRAPDGDMDGIPVVILEAMAAGLPVVTTGVSGLPEIVDEEVGWVVPPGDPEALVRALRAALDDPEEARRRGARGRERLVERGFTADVAHRAMLDVLGQD